MSSQPTSQHLEDDMVVVRPSKWTLTIITLLRGRTLRFNEIRRVSGGVSQKTLTTALRDLERDGFLRRTMFATIPPRVDYELTEMGHDLLNMADSWRDFAARNRSMVESARLKFDGTKGEIAIQAIRPWRDAE